MKDVPRDISEEILLNTQPSALFKLFQVNKKYYKISNDDNFWRKYYILRVNPKFEVEPELKVKGKWRQAFLKNYSIIHYVNFLTIIMNDMLLFKYRQYDDAVNILNEIYSNYILIKRKDNIITYAPILPMDLYKGDYPDSLHMIHPSMHVVDGRLKVNSRYDIYSNDLGEINSRLDGMNVILYPYHHNLIVDINTMEYHYRSDILGNFINIYEKTRKRKSINIEDDNEVISLDNGTWNFHEKDINSLYILSDEYIKLLGIALVIPS